MPKLGMEPIRRAALVEATIAEIGGAGSLDISVSTIARRAGMSSALAHHYFGGKDQIFAAAMRQILCDYKTEVVTRLATARTPAMRARAIIDGNFAASCFDPETISAWMMFYVQARTNPDVARLLSIYHRRLRSNLRAALRPVSKRPEQDAETLAALIDGLYLRAALGGTVSPQTATQSAHAVLDSLLDA